MEEMMTLMQQTHQSIINPNISSFPLPTWKLYDNPFYCFSQHPHHHLHFPSLFPLPPMISPSTSSSMQSDLELARAQIGELKAELEFERRMRKKVESMNKKLAKEAAEERKKREAMARLCEELAEQVASNKMVIDQMRKDMEEERKMMRIAEVWREERVQMKLEEARNLLMEKKTLGVLEEKADLMMGGTCGNENKVRSTSQRKGSPEAENPHIRRGIKGFVEEFPRVVRAVGSRGRQSGSNLECQRAQLRLLLRHKSPVGSGVAGPGNLNLIVR